MPVAYGALQVSEGGRVPIRKVRSGSGFVVSRFVKDASPLLPEIVAMVAHDDLSCGVFRFGCCKDLMYERLNLQLGSPCR